MNKQKRRGIFMDILIGALCIAALFALYAQAEDLGQKYFGAFLSELTFSDYISLVIAQFSTTFLIVSLLSLLSVKGQYIYWEEAVEYKIILPPHLNFISSSIYAFLTLLGSLLALFLEKGLLVIVFFLLNTLILIFLTFRMTSIFFDRDAIMDKLRKKILKTAAKYAKKKKQKDYDDISSKLNALYENTYKMVADKNYKQVIDSNIHLIVELSEQLNKNYNNNLAKLYYSTLSRIFMIFENDSNYFLSVIYYKYNPFGENGLSKHTQSMIQNALYDLFEAILRNGHYRVAYDYWAVEIYEHLEQNYWQLFDQKNSTGFLTEETYVNYEGEELFVKYDSEMDGLGPLKIYDKRFALAEEKYMVFCQLLEQSNRQLLLKLIKEHNMPLEIMQKIGLLQILADGAHEEAAAQIFENYLKMEYVFPFDEYIEKYEEYVNAADIIQKVEASGGTAWSIYQIHMDKIYMLNPFHTDLLQQCIHKYRCSWMVFMTLKHISKSLMQIGKLIESYKTEDGRDVYSLIFNPATETQLVENAYITNADALYQNLLAITNEVYTNDTGTLSKALQELCERKTDISTFARKFI